MKTKKYKDIKTSYYSHNRHKLLKFVPSRITNVLDIGCAKGNFGKLLKDNLDCKVWGIELDKESALEASLKLDNVLNMPFDVNTVTHLKNQKFDCIFFNDVLEHLVDPYEAIKTCKSLLTKEGYIVSSIPNILHFNTISKIILDLDWKYEKAGILDRTHVRFFTKKSIIRMFQECNFEIVSIKGINPCNNYKLKLLNLLFLNYFESMNYTQYITVAKMIKKSI